MTNDDFDFQPLAAEEKDILSLEDFKSQGQSKPVPASARVKKSSDGERKKSRKKNAEQDDGSAGLEYIEAELPARKKASSDDAEISSKPAKKKTVVRKKSASGSDGGVKTRKRREKAEDDYVPYADAPTGDWSDLTNADDDETAEEKKSHGKRNEGRNGKGDDMLYPVPDGSRIVDAYTVVEKAEYEKVDISPEEAAGLIPYEALRDMCNEFTKIQGAGVSIRGALRIVKEQTEDEDLKEALDRVYEGVKMGDDLSEAMNKCKCFPFAFTIAVSAAEKNDMISHLFGRFGEIFADEVRNKEHRKVSIFYPLLTTSCAMAIMLIFCVGVFPAFMDMLSALGIEQSGMTAAIFSAALTVRRVWWLLLILIVLIFAGIILFKLAKENDILGSRSAERLMREGSYERMTVYVKFVRYMNALLKVGVATKDALFVTAHSFLEYPFITDMLLEAANAAAAGSTLSNALCVSDFFPMMILQMISVGEEMGDTPGMLEYIAGYYEEEARRKEAEEQAAKGPVTIVIMAVTVLLLLLMMLLPMLALFRAVK